VENNKTYTALNQGKPDANTMFQKAGHKKERDKSEKPEGERNLSKHHLLIKASLSIIIFNI